MLGVTRGKSAFGDARVMSGYVELAGRSRGMVVFDWFNTSDDKRRVRLVTKCNKKAFLDLCMLALHGVWRGKDGSKSEADGVREDQV